MQPEDPKQDFTQPTQTPYVGVAPQAAPEPTTESVAGLVESQDTPQVESVAAAPIAESVVGPPQQTEAVEQPLPEQIVQTPENEPVKWQADEYHHHENNIGWYIVFGFVTLLLIAVAIFVIKSPTFAVLVPIMAVALVLFSHRPPRTMTYVLSNKGLYIDDTLHSYAEFKGFGVLHDGNEYMAMLLPVRRFQPGISIYFPEETGEAIVDTLGTRLPMQPLKLDMLDRVVQALRL